MAPGDGGAALGTLPAAVGRRARLTDGEYAGFAQRDTVPIRERKEKTP